MNISVPSSLKTWVDKQVHSGGFGTASEFIRHLIRDAKARDAARSHIDDLLEEGLDSGPATPMRAADWASIRREIRKRVAKANQARRKSA
jgi:antitoxin ParD1/3/4